MANNEVYVFAKNANIYKGDTIVHVGKRPDYVTPLGRYVLRVDCVDKPPIIIACCDNPAILQRYAKDLGIPKENIRVEWGLCAMAALPIKCSSYMEISVFTDPNSPMSQLVLGQSFPVPL